MIGKFKTGNLLPADFRASPYLYSAALSYFMRRYHHFSFDKDFIHNQWAARPTG